MNCTPASRSKFQCPLQENNEVESDKLSDMEKQNGGQNIAVTGKDEIKI